MLIFDEHPPENKKEVLDAQLAKVLNVRNSRAKVVLSTRLGRQLDRISYVFLFWAIISLILCCAAYFYIATGTGHGIKVPACEPPATACVTVDETRANALYLSIVTFSSLGYGDWLPEGGGKAVAVFEVLAGLILTAIFVGKIASERQSTSLLLLLTSDNQRRLQEFSQNLQLLEQELSSSLINHEHARLLEGAERGLSLIASIRKFLTFQANQAELATFGNVSALRTLYRTLASYQAAATSAFKTANADGAPRVIFGKIITEVHAIAEVMVSFHPDDLECKRVFLMIGLCTREFSRIATSCAGTSWKPVFLTEITEPLLQRVLQILGRADFFDYPDKLIARELGIARRMAQRCIDALVKRGDYQIPSLTIQRMTPDLLKKLAVKKEKVRRRSLTARIKRGRFSTARSGRHIAE